MVELRPSADYPYTLHICDKGGYQIGRIYYNSMVQPLMKTNVKSNEELELLNSIDKPKKYLQIESVEIYDAFRKQGFFRKTMFSLERFAEELKLEAVIIFDSGPLIDFYESIGYKKIGSLESISLNVLKKEVYK